MSQTISSTYIDPKVGVAPPAPPSPPPADPAMVAIPTVISGAIGLFLTTAGFVPATVGLAALPTILASTCLGLMIGTIWAAALGQNIVATLYAVFLGFYASYAAMQLGLAHGWYNVPSNQAGLVVQVYLICWLATIVMLMLATLRLPWIFTLLLGLVVAALGFLLYGSYTASVPATNIAAALILGFISVAVYLYFHVMSLAFGGKGWPLGRALVA